MKNFKLLTLLFLFSIKSWSYCEAFPKNNIWNTKITNAPLHKNSKLWLDSLGLKKIHPDFGSPTFYRPFIGIPINYTNQFTQKYSVQFTYKEESDKQAYPIPFNVKIEGGSLSTGDRHIISIDTDTCLLYELFNAHRSKNGQWTAGSGAIFDLKSNDLRPLGWTSADAAGLPIYPGLVKYHELASGTINHALRFTIPKTSKNFIWPARHFASKKNDQSLPPMGMRLRLKSSFNINVLSPQAKVIAKTLQEYGMILADNGGALFITGEPNENWDNDGLRDLKQLNTHDFEVVDVFQWQKSQNSAEASLIKSKILEKLRVKHN
tara:strand:+ start:4370 stop:5332 length:963 start_codon:yes stop_codon:yes gene_type:complete